MIGVTALRNKTGISYANVGRKGIQARALTCVPWAHRKIFSSCKQVRRANAKGIRVITAMSARPARPIADLELD